MSKAKICIYTRLAASKVGATTMDRPEWVAANPNNILGLTALIGVASPSLFGFIPLFLLLVNAQSK
jgi:hypothetical protein